MMPWSLRRSPMAPGVPLEGSDTVQGLRTLERLRRFELLQAPEGPDGGGGSGGGWRRAFLRYKGPFVEQLTADDLQQAPKSWRLFWRGTEHGQAAQAYNLPASLEVLVERTEENFVTFLPNYLRLAAGVLLATFYLRPKALLGAAAVVGSLYRSATLAYRRQQQQQQAAAAAGAAAGTDGRAARQQQQQQPQANAAAGMPVNRRWAAGTDPNEQLVTAATTLLTWLLVAYTRCLPMLMLGSAASLAVVLVHCGVRRAPSEYRHKGRQPLGFTWQQVLGREPAPDGANPRALFKQVAAASLEAAARRVRQGQRYCRYYALAALDTLKNPCSLWAG